MLYFMCIYQDQQAGSDDILTNMRKVLVIASVVIVIMLAIYVVFRNNNQTPVVDSFEACAAKYPVRESYPEVCATPDGQTFVNPTQHL